jgi:hypothetical protein
MNLYIETENGITKNHPACEDNLLQVFGSIPAHWEPFTRIERPALGVYQVLESPQAVYTKVNGVWTDVWSIREMITEEKTVVQQAVRDAFNNREYATNWSAWVLDEATCKMVPPIPRPAQIEDVLVAWCGADNNWKEVPSRPEGEYKFNFFAWDWVAL